MKIAITSSGESLDSPLDVRLGRANYLVLMDLETGEFTVINNHSNRDLSQGAGIQAAEAICRSEAEAVITGHCGPKAFRVLAAAGIAVITGGKGTVREVLDQYQKGELKPTASADVEGHWI